MESKYREHGNPKPQARARKEVGPKTNLVGMATRT